MNLKSCTLWVSFDIIGGGGAGKGITDVLSGTVTFGMVSRDLNGGEISKGAFAVGVAKDAVLLTMNEKNPVPSRYFKERHYQRTTYRIYGLLAKLKPGAIC